MMKKRLKTHPALYPHWRRKKESPALLCKARDGWCCVDCGRGQRTTYFNAQGQFSMIFLHAAHVHPLDPDPVGPIEGQRLRTRCASCHGSYDADWKERQAEVDHQITLHGIPLSRFIMQRFSIVVSFRVLTIDRQWLQRLTVPGQLSAWIDRGEHRRTPSSFLEKRNGDA